MQTKTEYYPNGNKRAECTLDADGLKHGKEISWWSNGVLYEKCDYVHGQKHGKEIRYSRYRGKVHEGNFRRGRLHGKWIEYFGNGDIKLEIDFERGEFHGEYKIWDVDQKRFLVDVWERDKKIKIGE